MNIKSSICGIQHTCINFLIFLMYNYKNRVLACFQTRPVVFIEGGAEMPSVQECWWCGQVMAAAVIPLRVLEKNIQNFTAKCEF